MTASLVTTRASSQPRLLVRAETRIELRAERGASGATVHGVLRDDQGEPLAGREVVIAARGLEGTTDHRSVARTDDLGRFTARLELPTGGYRLDASFAGDELHAAWRVERDLDLDRAEVRLSVELADGGQLDLDRRTHIVTVRAQSRAGVRDLAIRLRNEYDALHEGHTDAEGRIRFELEASQLGPPGAGRLTAISERDETRAGAQTEVPIVRFRATQLSLRASASSLTVGDSLQLDGRLTDSQGPIDRRAVGLFAGDEHLATALTDLEGQFVATVDVHAELGSVVEVRARYESDNPGRSASESAPITLRIAPAAPTPWTWLLLPIAICGAAFWFLSRSHRGRQPRPRSAPARPPAGVQAGVASVRRAQLFDIGGQIVDHRDDDPIGGGMVTLTPDGGEPIPLSVGADGRFVAGDLATGHWTLRVEARGYSPAEARLKVPHRGEWSRARVRLESLRARALGAFRRVALRLLPSERLWTTETNREVLARAQSAPADLPPLAHRIESAYYGPEPPTGGEVEDIQRRADRVLGALVDEPPGQASEGSDGAR